MMSKRQPLRQAFVRQFHLPLFCLILLCSACGEDDAVPTTSASDYFPLAVGSYWVYETYVEDELSGFELDTITVLEVTEEGDDFVFQLSEAKTFFVRTVFPTRLRLSDGKLFREDGNETQLFLTADPADAGMVVHTNEIDPAFGLIEYRYEENPQTIITAAGTFDCINMQGKIQASDPEAIVDGYIINSYFAPGVGLVQHNNFFWSNGDKFEARLVSFMVP